MGPNDETNFHKYGQALSKSKFPGETEALVNFPYIVAMNYGLGEELNEVVKYSFVPEPLILTNPPGPDWHPIVLEQRDKFSNSTTSEVRYQHRGYVHYFEIVDLLEWCP